MCLVTPEFTLTKQESDSFFFSLHPFWTHQKEDYLNFRKIIYPGNYDKEMDTSFSSLPFLNPSVRIWISWAGLSVKKKKELSVHHRLLNQTITSCLSFIYCWTWPAHFSFNYNGLIIVKTFKWYLFIQNDMLLNPHKNIEIS